MNLEKKYTQILMYRGDWSIKIHEKIKIKYIYALTPNAFSEVKGNTSYKIKINNDIFSDHRHKRVLVRYKKFEKIFKDKLHENNFISEAGKEGGLNYSYLLLSSYFSIFEMLKGQGPWLILNNGDWRKIDDIKEASELIFTRFFNTNYIHDIRNSKQFGKTLLKFINKIILKYFIKKKSFWVSGISYKLPMISESIKKIDKNYSALYPLNPDKLSILRSIKSLFKLIIFKNSSKNIIGIVPIKKGSISYTEEIYESLNIFQKFISIKTNRLLIRSINNIINESESYVSFFENFFNYKKPSFIISHHIRWKETTNLSLAAKKTSTPNFLISHGSHSKWYDSPSKSALKKLADGLLVSNLTDKVVFQSPLAYEAVMQIKKPKKVFFVKPIMWGYNFKKREMKINDDFTILHAGTYKLFASRPWIYETSQEFVNGLALLINTINKIKGIKLLIRIRAEQNECDLDAIRTLLPKSNVWEFSLNKSLIDDFKRCHVLFSYSSTTIEEALNSNIPVGLYGGNSRYRHIKNVNNKYTRKPVYHLSHKNLKNEIIKIKSLHFKKPLQKNELEGYVWDDEAIHQNKFFENIVNGIYPQ